METSLIRSFLLGLRVEVPLYLISGEVGETSQSQDTQYVYHIEVFYADRVHVRVLSTHIQRVAAAGASPVDGSSPVPP